MIAPEAIHAARVLARKDVTSGLRRTHDDVTTWLRDFAAANRPLTVRRQIVRAETIAAGVAAYNARFDELSAQSAA